MMDLLWLLGLALELVLELVLILVLELVLVAMGFVLERVGSASLPH